jgi:hypothetical protein
MPLSYGARPYNEESVAVGASGTVESWSHAGQRIERAGLVEAAA